DDDIRALGNHVEELRAHRFQATANGVPNHSGSYLLADDEPEPRPALARCEQHGGDEPRTAATRAASNHLAVVDTASETIRPGEHGGTGLRLTPRARCGPSRGGP